MATLGNTEVRDYPGGFTNTTFPGNASTISASQFPLQVNDGVFTSMSTYCASITGITARLFMFNDDGNNTPASLIAMTTVASLASVGWLEIPFTSPFTLNSGLYWLGIAASGGVTTRSLTSVTGQNRVGNEANTFPAVTTSFLSVTSSNFQKPIYATFTLPSVFSGTIN